LAAELLRDFEFDIAQLTLIPSDGGRFEVAVDGELIYSKLATRKHADPAQVKQMVRERIQTSS
jgi:selenoprotein W-related protein